MITYQGKKNNASEWKKSFHFQIWNIKKLSMNKKNILRRKSWKSGKHKGKGNCTDDQALISIFCRSIHYFISSSISNDDRTLQREQLLRSSIDLHLMQIYTLLHFLFDILWWSYLAERTIIEGSSIDPQI